MKLVLAYIQPLKLEAVRLALEVIPHFPGMTVVPGYGFGREKVAQPPRSIEEELEPFSDKVRIETVLHEEQVEAAISAISDAVHTGRHGDGMIFVLPVERAVRIMNRRQGEEVV